MDHMWDGFYTGQKHKSQFSAMIETTGNYTVEYTGTPFANMRYQMRSPNGKIKVKVPYWNAGSYSIWVNEKKIPYTPWNKDYLSKASSQPAKTIIISLGANDHKGVKTEAELRKMREAVKGDRVFWIDPGQDRKPIPHDAIVRIAKEYGDVILPRPKSHMSADGIHPTGRGYKILGDQTR